MNASVIVGHDRRRSRSRSRLCNAAINRKYDNYSCHRDSQISNIYICFFHVPGPTKTSGGAALPGKRKETVLLGNKRTVVPVVPVVPVVFAVFVEFVEFVLV